MKHGLVILLKIMAVTLLLSGCSGLGVHPMGWGAHSMFQDTRVPIGCPLSNRVRITPGSAKTPKNSPFEGGDFSCETGAKRC